MRAFHSDPAIKERYLDRVKAHRAADELIRGEGWDGHRGCAIGCTLDGYDHSRYPIELGIPEQLAHLEDWLFEHLPVADAMAWPERVLTAIHVGADLSRVWPEFAIWILVDPEHGVLQDAVDISTRAAIVDVADLYRRTDAVSPEEWEAAHLAAARAAAAAATAAAAVRASAAREAAWAAREAARAAREAWAAAAAVVASNAARIVASRASAARKRSFNVFRDDDGGVLFELGDPHSVRWYCEGRTATRAEVMASIDGGLPILLAEAEKDGPYAVSTLNEMMARAITLVPGGSAPS